MLLNLNFDPKENFIKDVVVLEEDGKLTVRPKKPNNSLRFLS